jgi:hypothetical protein
MIKEAVPVATSCTEYRSLNKNSLLTYSVSKPAYAFRLILVVGGRINFLHVEGNNRSKSVYKG